MFIKLSVSLITLLCFVQLTISARILMVLPCPSLSHHLFYRQIINALHARGHAIVAISADPILDPKLTNLTEINVHDIAYNAISATKWLEDSQYKSMSQVDKLRDQNLKFGELADGILSSPQVQNLIKNPSEHFDLVINELLMFTAQFFAFKERFNCPSIGLVSMDVFLDGMDAIGNPVHPNYNAGPQMIGGSDLSFWKRLELFWHHIDYRLYYYFEFIPMANELVNKYFGIKTTAWELQKSMDLVIANSNPLLHMSRPLVPAYIEIGGLHERKLESLPQDLQEFLDDSKQGVVYFSLGSNIKSENLPLTTRQSIIKAFEKLPYNVLWKWGNETLVNHPKNVFIKSWLPQSGVLAHPNLKAFVTQGGLQSLEEAIRRKVPIVGIPFGGDQGFNIHRVQELGIGRELLLKDITTESVFEAISEVAGNPKYKIKMSKLSDLYWDQPTKPLDRAVWWIEYVIRHKGAQHLRSPAVDLPWHKYLLLDILAFILVVFVLSILTLIVFVKMILKRFVAKSLKTKKC